MHNLNGIEAFGALRRYLATKQWDAAEIVGEHSFKAHAQGELCPCTYFFQIKVELEEFLFYIVPEIAVPPETFPAVAEFIARANFGMRIGGFELDYRDGQVCFRGGINFRNDRLSVALIEGVVGPALQAFGEFFPGLARVIVGIESAAAAIAAIEFGTGEVEDPAD